MSKRASWYVSHADRRGLHVNSDNYIFGELGHRADKVGCKVKKNTYSNCRFEWNWTEGQKVKLGNWCQISAKPINSLFTWHSEQELSDRN